MNLETTKLKNPLTHFTDFDDVKDQILYKLVSKNATEFSGRPYMPYLDLAIIFFIALDITDDGLLSIPINNDLLRVWDVDTKALMACAQKNTPNLFPLSFESMDSMIEEHSDEISLQDNENYLPCFILSNETRCFGATSILYDGVLHLIRGLLKKNYFIIPSSIHELLILPDDGTKDKDYFRETICFVNEKLVAPDERLSDHPYYYDRSLGKLLIP
ncbi:DUF5688 family protein [Blautia coccoides]|uniref:DUF1444 family protein n=1 Tax=Blautia producta TaxID=33035 RepID=A0ABZ0U547_9FIRM|nr:DUF5688 family protein [Blautia coccoides]MCR1990086.1 DUF5688 family protein [Blautia coccoides]TCO46587.1 hypothetical protein EV205_16113 [Blautia coccoides]WPX72354.1 hypothetical protein BLCOC_06900 [Blautia coccoides]SUY05788.1 transcriptional regulator [Blautia coccoides]